MVLDCHASPSSASPSEEHQRFLDDYDPLGDDSALENQKSARPDKVTPIPTGKLATLCAVRLVDPITFTQIFPYVNEMMEHIHVTDDHSKIGFYSGIVVRRVPYIHPIRKVLRNDAVLSVDIRRKAALPSHRSYQYTSGHGYQVCLVVDLPLHNIQSVHKM